MNKLNEKVIRKLIKEEINSNKQYRHMSEQQKFMLEQGVVSKIAGAVKGVVGKVLGKKGAAPAEVSVGKATDNSPEGVKKEILEKIDGLLKRIPAYGQWDGVLAGINDLIAANAQNFGLDNSKLGAYKKILVNDTLDPNLDGRGKLENLKKMVNSLQPVKK
jgi:hypothetical protein